MATSPRAFLIELYEEYLEEASFLYEQRRTLFNNPEVTWKKIGEFEERLEANIDGLVVGEKLAVDVCKRRAAEGDPGELFAAVCVFCRQDLRDLALGVFDRLDPQDAEKISAVADALKYELPDGWTQDFLTLLQAGDPKLASMLARAFGYRRVPCGPQLVGAAKRCTAAALPELVWAIGRIAYNPAADLLLNYLQSEDEPVRAAAAVALTRMGSRKAVDYCLDQAPSCAWPVLPLGLAGSRGALTLFNELARKNGGADNLAALGLLGDPASVPLLISRLEQPEVASAAATALHCITGACISETVFIPDPVDDDELFDAGPERLKAFGTNVTRLSQDPEAWSQWWRTNNNRFTPGLRYVGGGLLSPARLIEMLSAETTPHRLRGFFAEELATNYAKDIGFETDTPARRQIGVLADASLWIRSFSRQFREGGWYFAGSAS